LNNSSHEVKPRGTLILTRRDVAALLSIDDCIAAVEDAFRHHAGGRTLGPGVLGVPAMEGGFHIKAAGLKLDRTWFAVKCNGNFVHNLARFGLPTIQGLILLCDGDNGTPLAVIDSIEITILRTGAATAVAARHLARADSRAVTICGCGNQGIVQLRALSRVLKLERVFAFDIDSPRAERYAAGMSAELGVRVEPVRDVSEAVRASDVCITCTPARSSLVRRDAVRPGSFIAGVGADSHDKQELDPRLFQGTKVVVDSLDQCASFGDLRHALAEGLTTRESVHAELAEIVAGHKPGRTSSEEITIFDSTGVALEDVAAAVMVYQRALETGAGTSMDFAQR